MDPVTLFLISFTLNLILLPLLLIFMFFVGRPLFVLLGAKIRGRTVLLVARKDKRLDFITGKYEGGMIRTKKYGDFMIIPQTAYLTTTGVSCGLVYEPYGVTIPQELIDSTGVLKEYNVKTYTEMEKVAPEIRQEYNNLLSQDLDLPITNPTETDVKELTEEEKERKRQEREAQLYILGRMTRAIDNVTNFFKYNVNPHAIRATVNRTVAEVVQQYQKTDWGKLAMFAMMIMIGGALAYYIITTAIPAGAGQAVSTIVPTPDLSGGGVVTGAGLT